MVKINSKDNEEQKPIHLENNDKTCQFFFACFLWQMIDKYAENLFTVLEDVLFERYSGIGLSWGDSIVVLFLFY